LDRELLFKSSVVGRIKDTFLSDMTWYGVFIPADEMPNPVRDFIVFCKSWHDRLKKGYPHSAEEFDSYRDILASGLWQTRGPEGQSEFINDIVFVEDDVSWITIEGSEESKAKNAS
jgi:hypothetical protein